MASFKFIDPCNMSIEDSVEVSSILDPLASELSCGQCKKEYKTQNKLMLHIRKVHCATNNPISATQAAKKLDAKDSVKKLMENGKKKNQVLWFNITAVEYICIFPPLLC